MSVFLKVLLLLAGSGSIFDRVNVIASVLNKQQDGSIAEEDLANLIKDKEPDAPKLLVKANVESITKAANHFDVVRSVAERTEYPVSDKKDNDTYLILAGSEQDSDGNHRPAFGCDLELSSTRIGFMKVFGLSGRQGSMEAEAISAELTKIPNGTHVLAWLNTPFGPWKVEHDVMDKGKQLECENLAVTKYVRADGSMNQLDADELSLLGEGILPDGFVESGDDGPMLGDFV